jgi:hypothetical protein
MKHLIREISKDTPGVLPPLSVDDRIDLAKSLEKLHFDDLQLIVFGVAKIIHDRQSMPESSIQVSRHPQLDILILSAIGKPAVAHLRSMVHPDAQSFT